MSKINSLILICLLFLLLIPTVYAQDEIIALNPFSILFYTLSSLIRMLIAFLISLAFAITYGIIAAKKARAEKILIPILDILQSVPILGFFPAAVFFFIALFDGSWLGVEFAAIFLIFTSMAWNLTFAVYEQVSSIPKDIEEASESFGVKGWTKIRKLYIPATVPKLVYNSIMSWAAGWYFLVAAEIISLGSKTYILQGIGSFLATSAYKGDFGDAFLGLGALVTTILLIDIFVWRPLEAYANRFKYDYVSAIEPSKEAAFPLSRLTSFLVRHPRPLIHTLSSKIVTIFSNAFSMAGNFFARVYSKLIENIIVTKIFSYSIILVLFSAFAYGLALLILEQGSPFIESFELLFVKNGTAQLVFSIPSAIILSMARLFVAYLIAVGWTLPVAIKISKSPRLFSSLMPIFQTFASIPAVAFFPFIFVLFIGLPYGQEFASILLILTGMQWYLLFNLIGGAKSIPSDIEEVAKTFNAKGGVYWRRFLLPSIYPSLVTGSITGWGGGWNALIVSEYIMFGGKIYSVLGIGALLDIAAYELGNVALLLLCVFAMIIVIFTINRLVWRRLYRIVVGRYRIEY
ncbi:MAG: ABC transporter permease subunit [archaeon]|nr:ABC transporter permease subunit [archaeon]MCP8315019.1 ABC transporter permease subunit [archaeon]MCP8319733.1 ABC transporter permease subunit [archaeon]